MATKAATGSQNLPDLTPRTPRTAQSTSKSLPAQPQKSRRNSFSKVPTRNALALRRTLAETSRCTRLPALEKLEPISNSEKQAQEQVQSVDISQSARRKPPSSAGKPPSSAGKPPSSAGTFGTTNFHRPWLDEVRAPAPLGAPPAAPLGAPPAPPADEPSKRRSATGRGSLVPAASAELQAVLSNVIAECSGKSESSGAASGDQKCDPEGQKANSSSVSNASTADTAGTLGENLRNSSKQVRSLGSTGSQPPAEQTARRWSSASSASLQSAFAATEEQVEPSTAKAAPQSWHVMLLDRTFNERSKSDVITILTEVLEITEKAAAKKISDASKHHVLVVATFPNQHEAFVASQKLRDRRLVVQVVSDSGRPGAQPAAEDKDGFSSDDEETPIRVPRRPSVSKTAPPQKPRRASFSGEKLQGQRRNSYNELFQEILPGQAHKDPSKLARPRRVSVPTIPLGPASHAAPSKQQQEKGHRLTITIDAPSAAETAASRPAEAEPSIKRGGLKALVRKVSQQSREHTIEHHGDDERQSSKDKGAGMDLWDVVLDELHLTPTHSQHQQLDKQQKEACMMMRIFVFGHLGTPEQLTYLEQEAMFREPMGTKQQVHALHLLWTLLDEDNSGRVDLQEFRRGAEVSMRHKFRRAGRGEAPGLVLPEELADGLPTDFKDPKNCARFISRLCDRCAGLLLGKKSSFAIQDMMRLMWPCAKVDAVKAMSAWCHEFIEESKKHRIEAPPVLDQEQFDDLCSIFRHYDEKGTGEIHFDHLVTVGLIYEDQIDKWREDWDADGNGLLDMMEFCDMMCPAGFRATENSLVGSQIDGRRVRFDHWIDGWRAEQMESIFCESALFERQTSKESSDFEK